MDKPVFQCKCGAWAHEHTSGKCRVCRSIKPKIRKPRKISHTPVFGSAEWAETRGDDLGESPDY